MRFLAFVFALGFLMPAYAGDTNIPGRVIIQDGDDAPTCSTASGAGMLCVEQAVEMQSTALVTGAATLSSTLAVSGATTLSGNLDMSANEIFATSLGFDDKTTNYTVVGDDCGTVISSNDDNRVITLPAVAAGNIGCQVTFVNTAADGAALISISPNSADGIYGTCCGVSGGTECVHLSGTDDKDAQNTKVTQDKGDTMTLVSDGSTGWYITSCIGVWASES